MGQLAEVRRIVGRIGAVCDQHYPSRRRRAAAVTDPSASKTFIVADDDEHWLKYMRRRLAPMEIECVSTLADALMAISGGRAGALILDWQWPTGSGLTVYQAAKAMGLPIVVCTGFPEHPTLPEGADVISKDDMSALERWVESVAPTLEIKRPENL